ncbi:uncharacterized protein LOC144107194 [Amblyomma americanum]
MLGLLLFLIGTAMVWASRQPQPPSPPVLNIEAIAGYGLKRHIFITVHETPIPQPKTPRRRASATTANTVTTTGTTTGTTKAVSPACSIDTTSFFCNGTVHGWYYNGEQCQSTEQDEYKVCPGFTYRYEDEHECESQWSQCNATRSCPVHQTWLFPCSSGDLSRSWYFFNITSSSCVQWGFAHGACPNVSGGFDTKASCERECNAATVDQKPECLQPSTLMPCPPDRMRQPYFYTDVLGGHCYRADPATLTGHRCVNRAGLFPTEADCIRACAPRLG